MHMQFSTKPGIYQFALGLMCVDQEYVDSDTEALTMRMQISGRAMELNNIVVANITS